ncbi:ww domain-containing oxidoreductase [Fusarium albosuccineum]|uniref:Ww domain-containing oxidoreductase n=1 Tax=Fusarium albosuccineum TaxID=1237068 RepID=A0A8H4LEU2_9HYPO|nr:ww domain-containing oxidoreductase [Fusarium albosuccineum]
MSKYAAAHSNPQGPGDARPTALQIIQDEGLVGNLTGISVFITGANQGVGLETTRAFHATGATVYLGVRDHAKGQQAIEDIQAADPANKAPLHSVEMSLDSLDSVRKGAQALLDQTKQLNILVLNAGVMYTPEGRTADGFETQFGINHLGHFLLFQLLKPALLAATTPLFNSRVVCVASMGHRAGEVRFHDFNFDEPGSYDPWVSYGQSKTANIYMVNEIEKRYGNQGLHALSLHPGGVLTNLHRYIVDPEILSIMSRDEGLKRRIKSPAQGAATTLYAALSKEWEGRGGRYLYDCHEAGPADPNAGTMSTDNGYAPWAYDEEKAAKLWVESCKMIGVEADD